MNLPETYRVLYQNKVEKYCIFLAFIIRIYHDAQSSECQIRGIVSLMVKDIILVETPHGEKSFEKDVRIAKNFQTNFRINWKCGKCKCNITFESSIQ